MEVVVVLRLRGEIAVRGALLSALRDAVMMVKITGG